MINWTNLFNELNNTTIQEFARGNLGYRDLIKSAKYTPVSGEVRKLLRKGGLKTARMLARKACKRRNIAV